MPKKPSGDLFELIRSMSRNEKIHFKRFAKRHADAGESNYIRLFDLIERQKKYDERKLLKAFPDRLALARTRNYLARMILAGLERYHGDSKAETVLKRQISHIQILYDKALYGQARRLIRKTKKAAYRFDEFPILLDALKWEIRLHGNDLNIRRIEPINREQKEIIQRFNTFLEIESLSNIMFGLYRSEGFTRNRTALGKANRIMEHPLIRNKAAALTTFLDIYNYHNIHGMYHYITGKFEASLQHRHRAIVLFEKRPEYIPEYFGRYYRSVLQAMGMSTLLYMEDEFFRLAARLRKALATHRKVITRESRLYIESLIFNQELQWHNHCGQFDSSAALIESGTGSRVIREMRKVARVSDLMHTCDLATRAYFGLGDFGKALEWVNPILNAPENTVPPALLNMARILNMLIHYELEHYDILESLIRASQHHFGKQKQTYRVELAVIRFMQKLQHIGKGGREYYKAFRKLRGDLLRLQSDPYQFFFFQDLDLIAWVDSRIHNRSFSKIIWEKTEAARKGKGHRQPRRPDDMTR